MARQVGHPMASAFEKAVADKMNMRGGMKQGANPMFNGTAMQVENLQGKKSIPRRYNLHPTNKTRISARRGMSNRGPSA